MKKVSILGAGPAGLSAAINLAKEGFQVDVYEKNEDVGKRFNGDFQGLENWTEKEDILKSFQRMNIECDFDYTPFTELTLTNCNKFWNFSLDKPAFYLVKRGSMSGTLDHALKELALDVGVDIHFGISVPEEEVNVVATGPIPSETVAIARAIVFETDMDDMVLAIVNNQLAIKGYSYLLVAGGHGTISTVLFDEFNHLNECFIKTQEVLADITDIDVQNPQDAGGFGCFSNKNVYEHDGMLYVGEAAGLQDFLWGFGIRSAVTSGFFAAKSLIHKEDYGKMARNHFRKKLKAGIVNRFFWEHAGDYSLVVNRIHHAHEPLKYLRSFHNFNRIQWLFYPFALWYVKRRYTTLRL